MKVGIVGVGVVGEACRQGFLLQKHQVSIHDLALRTTINDVLDTDIVYICVSTSLSDDGVIDQSNVIDVVNLLNDYQYSGVVAIKSTVTPGTTEMLNKQTTLDICFVPEFLRERCAVEDFVTNHKLLAIGTASNRAYQLVVESHGTLPANIKQLSPTEAEILKYYNNVFNAVRVAFSNVMYEVCQAANANYNLIKEAYLLRDVASDNYMDCGETLRGYGGMCLPKDVKVLINYLKENNLDFELLRAIDNDNQKIKTTVFPGMRQ